MIVMDTITFDNKYIMDNYSGYTSELFIHTMVSMMIKVWITSSYNQLLQYRYNYLQEWIVVIDNSGLLYRCGYYNYSFMDSYHDP